jgi:hypothetical protein
LSGILFLFLLFANDDKFSFHFSRDRQYLSNAYDEHVAEIEKLNNQIGLLNQDARRLGEREADSRLEIEALKAQLGVTLRMMDDQKFALLVIYLFI